MRATASTLRSHWPEGSWLVFCAANLLFLVNQPHIGTIPFHFVWVSFTLLYGFRPWRGVVTAGLLGLVVVATGVASTVTITQSGTELVELVEVPLMASMFATMVWHGRRRQKALEDVRRIVEKQREFVRSASHQLRTPITVAHGHAELIRAAHEGDQTGLDAQVVLDELEQLVTISDRLFILAAAQHPEFLMWGTVDLRRLVENTAHRWSRRAPRRWEFDVRGNASFGGDEEHLGSALDALIENAVRFTGPGERIRVEGDYDRGLVLVRVADDGAGIPAADLESIFDPFRQAGAPVRTRNGGTGLGLAIVKAIVEGHGGRVFVDSTVGVGTTFELRLPPAAPVGNGFVSRPAAALSTVA